MVGPSAQAILENEVRELVRQRGIDPIAEAEVVARLVDEVVADYRDRSITAALPPLGDVVAATRSVLDAVAGFGPLQPLLDDPTPSRRSGSTNRDGCSSPGTGAPS